MKKTLLPVLLFVALLTLAGCGQKAEQVSNTIDAIKGAKEAADLGKAVEQGNAEDAAKAIENIANIGAEMEKKEFEKTVPVDMPEKFPSQFSYSNGKTTEASDQSTDEENLSITITQKTLDELNAIKDFYKKALTENNWKITVQNNSSDGGHFEARNDRTNEDATIDIAGNQYSKIREITISYNKSAR